MWAHLLTDGVLLTRDLTSNGYSHVQIRRHAARGDLVSLRRGAWVPAQTLTRQRRHELATIASCLLALKPTMASHTSAVLLHGLPIWKAPLETVHLMRRGKGSQHSGKGLTLHRNVQGVDPVSVGAVYAVSVADAIVQHGLLAPFGSDQVELLIAADAALQRKSVTQEELEAAVARHRQHTGIGATASALRHADGRHESPGETILAADLRQTGVRSTPQVTIAVGQKTYRVDRLLDEAPVIIEYDGRGKYQATNAIPEEKQREDALRALGYGFVRVYWEHLRKPDTLAERIQAAVSQTRRGRVA